jgi:hypothetical protein
MTVEDAANVLIAATGIRPLNESATAVKAFRELPIAGTEGKRSPPRRWAHRAYAGTPLAHLGEEHTFGEALVAMIQGTLEKANLVSPRRLMIGLLLPVPEAGDFDVEIGIADKPDRAWIKTQFARGGWEIRRYRAPHRRGFYDEIRDLTTEKQFTGNTILAIANVLRGDA